MGFLFWMNWLTDRDCLKHRQSQSTPHPEFPAWEKSRLSHESCTASRKLELITSCVKTLTTAFFGLACSWDMSSSCSGVQTRTLLRTLNQPLQTDRAAIRLISGANRGLLPIYTRPTWHPLVTQQTPDRFSHRSQCWARSPFHDCPQSLCKEANRCVREAAVI